MNIFEFLTIFDWVSPAIETGKDVSYTLSTGKISSPISTRHPHSTKKQLEDAGITIISVTTGWGGGYVDVPDEQVETALAVLGYSTLEG